MTDEIACEFKDRCSDYPTSCKTCKHNKGKKSHYEPTRTYYQPTYPTYWPYPIWPPDDATWKPDYPKKPQW